ncbi:MAG: class I SAM-dependent methyltransferase [Patescibacteria group bacterium]|jgi:SAM-dependent methyltransferase
MDKEILYWEKRGLKAFDYRGESFYTITPVPFYVKRRKTLLSLTLPYFKESFKKICDFGCGDGWYIKYYKNKLNFLEKINFFGVDISTSMIERARKLNPECDFFIFDKNNFAILKETDLVYSYLVFSHIADEEVIFIFSKIKEQLLDGGNFIIFEQVASCSYKGATFYKRTIDEYIEIGKRAGLKVDSKILLSFRIHNFFQKHIAERLYNFYPGETDYEKRINANKSSFFRLLSSVFLFFDFFPIKSNNKGNGNVLLSFSKK